MVGSTPHTYLLGRYLRSTSSLLLPVPPDCLSYCTVGISYCRYHYLSRACASLSLLGPLPLSFYFCLYRFSSLSLLLPDCWARNESNNRASSRLVAGPKLPSTTASSLLTLRLHPFGASASKAKSSQAKPNQNQNQRNATPYQSAASQSTYLLTASRIHHNLDFDHLRPTSEQ